MGKINLFIFDMDGLMFDTGRLAYRSYLKSAEQYDYQMTHNVYYYLTGKTDVAILAEMANLYGADQPTAIWREAMGEFKDQIFAEEQRAFKKKGLIELLEFAKANQVIVAVASSNSYDKVNQYLEIEDVKKYVDILVTGTDVTKGKPDPEIFLTALDKAGVKKEAALVFEDSRAGIEAANRGGIAVVLVDDDITDLPIRDTGHPLLMDLSQFREQPHTADFQFSDLLAARDYLKEHNLEI